VAGVPALKETVRPPAGAAELSVTVPVGAGKLPPARVFGLSETLTRVGALIVSGADTAAPFRLADTLTVVSTATATVETLNVAVVAPAATRTLAGTVAGDVVLRVTVEPPAGVAELRVTVPVLVAPPATVEGERLTLSKVGSGGAVTVSVAISTMPLSFAVMFAVAPEATAEVVTVNAADVWPARMVTLAGAVAAALSLERATTRPPTGAALLTVTVPVEEVPPRTEVGLSDSVLSTGAVTVKGAVTVTPFSRPDSVTGVSVATAKVVIGNVAET
jgi:hypothetical protein